jgi:hypothetical protein
MFLRTIFCIVYVTYLILTKSLALAGELPEAIVGSWSTDCNDINTFIVNNTMSVLTVNENQIVINTRMDAVDKSQFRVSFISTDDLGEGGETLQWPKFSRTKPIALMQLERGAARLTWLGFFNVQTGKYEWTTGPDFYNGGRPIILKKCSN